MDLTTATPVEIDTRLADLFGAIDKLGIERERAKRRIRYITEQETSGYGISHSQETLRKLRAEEERLDGEIQAILNNDVGPIIEEFNRRGGWTRYYLVDNTNGHVHRDQHCTTCFVDTRYFWLVEQSGMSAEDLVELAGEKACTVCFPWAPVDTLKRKTLLEAPERKKAREERERKRAEAAAKKAAKAIANPDGSPLEVFDWRVPERQIMRGGRIVKVEPAYDRYETIATLAAARSWLTDQFEAWRGNNGTHRDTNTVADAIAHKEGKTREQVIEEAKKRAARRK